MEKIDIEVARRLYVAITQMAIIAKGADILAVDRLIKHPLSSEADMEAALKDLGMPLADIEDVEGDDVDKLVDKMMDEEYTRCAKQAIRAAQVFAEQLSEEDPGGQLV